MKKAITDIFKNIPALSREELQQYAEGKLRGEKLRNVEKWIADNGIEAEAIEGLLADPQSLSVLPEKPPFLSGNSGNQSGRTVLILTLVIAIAGTFYLTNSLTNKTSSSEKNLVTGPVTDPVATVTEKQSASEQIREIEEAEPLQEKEQITYEKTKRDQPVTKQVTPDNQKSTEINPEEIIAENIAEKQSQPIKTVTEKKVEYSNVKFKYIVDLKVIDYSNLYTSSISKQEIETALTGLSANYENEDSKKEKEPEIRTVYVPYESYLKETLEHFSRNDYKTALKNFKIIHKHYPEDLNAFFYGGLCYYNLNKCEKAISWFEKCINGSFNTFSEEAAWYKALSLHRCKRTEEANQLFKKIADAGGFYSEKALVKLSEPGNR